MKYQPIKTTRRRTLALAGAMVLALLFILAGAALLLSAPEGAAVLLDR
ncbi:hypothetical protein [Sphingomicrobium astaxanthinifaciens]|nr:hypothetical protein [Sphingomicrobium astaxanthinifaciens]MCJ7420863.1 hypothetical protein [Sphingomicrobium astaxanthinifaciens]